MRPLPRFLSPKGPPRSNARQRVLAAWRGVDVSRWEQMRQTSSQPASSVLPKVLKDLRIDRRQAEAEILRVWNHLIDPTITTHAQPTGIHRGTLFVTVDSPVWRDEIVRYRRKEILDRLQHSFGRDLIARISFRIG
jgi:predicted nucleic acid-binding Zn ribbon protein